MSCTQNIPKKPKLWPTLGRDRVQRRDIRRSESYFWHLRQKEYFLEEENEEELNNAQISLCPPSTWMPPKGRDSALETYIKRTRKVVEPQLNNLQAKRTKDNILSEERMALRHVRQ